MPAPDPGLRSAGLPDRLVLPDVFDLTFTGFGPEAFSILERLREHPHIEQYRKEKELVDRHIVAPFKRYRDDLAANLVIPNALPFETERNVFSRLLKNDFGQGGTHHHLWMSFYRVGGKRLTDIQLPHSLDPDGLSVGLWIGPNAPARLRAAKRRIVEGQSTFSDLVSPLMDEHGFRCNFYIGLGSNERAVPVDSGTFGVMKDMKRVTGLWLRREFGREEVLHRAGRIVEDAAGAVAAIWPVYAFLAGGADDE